jgi:hypothetical protein
MQTYLKLFFFEIKSSSQKQSFSTGWIRNKHQNAIVSKFTFSFGLSLEEVSKEV